MHNTLFEVWGDEEGYVALATKDNKWSEAIFNWPQDKDKIILYINENLNKNLYWCPTILTQPRRKKDCVAPTHWLWADLDAVNPETIPIRPTIAWQSSPGRYQCLWKLKDKLPTDIISNINKKLSYYIGADKGGWDLTQVLRVPGSNNYKYEGGAEGKLLWFESKEYSLIDFKDIPEVTNSEVDLTNLYWLDPGDTLPKLLGKYKSLDPEIYQLLLTDNIEDYDRSEALWKLECKLAESGVSVEDIVKICALSPWNKYYGRSDEIKRLNIEAQKAYDMHRPIGLEEYSWTSYSSLMGSNLTKPSWLVEGFWGLGDQGIVAGEPKTYKSVITTDLAISVASGKPFLGYYPVNTTGPVLIIQQENKPVIMKDRMMKIAYEKGLLGQGNSDGYTVELEPPKNLPIYMLNNAGFDLTSDKCLSELEEMVKKVKPVLVILDPLYLMLGGIDENSMKELRPILNYLLELKLKYKFSLILVHHWNKSGLSKRGGQRMYGSVAFHGWIESAMYLSLKEKNTIVMEREFRAFEKPDDIELRVTMGHAGEVEGYRVEITELNSVAPSAILGVLSVPRSLSEICEITGWGRKKAQNIINEYISKGLIICDSDSKKGRGNKAIYRKVDEE